MKRLNLIGNCPPRRTGAALLVSLIALAGCGDGMARVKGQVTLNGNPVEGGKNGAYVIVQFHPANGTGPTGAAVLDESGRYTMGTGSHYGVVPGEYVVACTYRPANPNDPVPVSKILAYKDIGNEVYSTFGQQ
jgi:hypothetical protein